VTLARGVASRLVPGRATTPMLRKLSSRFPWLADALTALVFVLGTI
jgi:hypothetical protein